MSYLESQEFAQKAEAARARMRASADRMNRKAFDQESAGVESVTSAEDFIKRLSEED